MNERQATAREIFQQAIDITDSSEQAEFVANACGDEPELCKLVDDLLAAHTRAGSVLGGDSEATRDVNYPDRGNSDFTEAICQDLGGDARPGVVIRGRYELLENIGESGMGSVWVAKQTSPVKRKVAIKLIKAGMDSRQVHRRFEAERQALAVMDHPNIAKILDGGMTEQGRPYFEMEYVKGIPFTKYCDDAKLSLKDRLQLFIPVCQAVQHAHHKGIVHRDLKPTGAKSN